MTTSTRIFVFALLVAVCSAFAPAHKAARSTTSLSAAQKFPKFDGEKWVYTSPDQEPSAGYGATKTLLLHGPQPFFNRVFQTDDYEQVSDLVLNVGEAFFAILSHNKYFFLFAR